jgi:hypothetical protein
MTIEYVLTDTPGYPVWKICASHYAARFLFPGLIQVANSQSPQAVRVILSKGINCAH